MPDYLCNFGALPYTAAGSATFVGRFILTTFAAAATFFLLTEVVAEGKILRMELAFMAVAVGAGVKVRNHGPQVSLVPRTSVYLHLHQPPIQRAVDEGFFHVVRRPSFLIHSRLPK